ncbi:MAG: hypothetical protein KAT71_08120 [Gammaproteobacteria bacterium]|nr:hypothetical protein [Gammaproteobacteria bacterium]
MAKKTKQVRTTRRLARSAGYDVIIRRLERSTPHEIKMLLSPTGDLAYDDWTKAIWKKWFFSKFYKYYDSEMHADMGRDMTKMFGEGKGEFAWVGWRENGKTATAKPEVVYAILYEQFEYGIVQSATKASQFTTDVYNMLLEPEIIRVYGNQFSRDALDYTKRQQTMSTFTTKHGIRLESFNMLTTTRGSSEQEKRPDLVIMDDFENNITLDSPVITEKIYRLMRATISGMAQARKKVLYLGNYLSEAGNVHKVVESKGVKVTIQPVIDADGNLLWPDKYTHTKEEARRANLSRPLDRHKVSLEEISEGEPFYEQEYLCQPEKFGDAFFNKDHIAKCFKPEKAKDAGVSDSGLRYYRPKREDFVYVVGADTSEGIGRDSNTGAVLEVDIVSRIVACYDNAHIAPDDFGLLLGDWGRYYNNALVAPERNNTGHAVISTLKSHYYHEYIYRMENADTENETPKFGFITTAPSKLKALGDFKLALKRGDVEFYDEKLFNELVKYTKVDAMGSKATTRHFDLLMAVIIAWQAKGSVYDVEPRIT